MNVHGGVRSESDLGVCFNVHNFVSTLSDQEEECDRVFLCNSFSYSKLECLLFQVDALKGLFCAHTSCPLGELST